MSRTILAENLSNSEAEFAITGATKMERHELSSLFGNMTELEFDELKADVEQNGFAQPKIYTFQGKILDGWHRYQVAVTLERVDELEFFELGDISNPLAFAMGINYFRRQMSASHKAVVKALAHKSEWGQLGDNQYVEGVQHCTPKSSAEMAAEVKVSKRLMDAAKKVVRLGLADEVIKKGKSVNEVLKENNRVKLCFIEPDTLHHYEVNRSVPIGYIPKLLHELYCPAGRHSKHVIYIVHNDKKTEFVQCEQCFEEGNYDGAGCDRFGTCLDNVKSIIKELTDSPDAVQVLEENPEMLNQLRQIAVDYSILINDAERVIAKNVEA